MLFSAGLGTELCEQTNHIFHMSITNHMSRTLFIHLLLLLLLLLLFPPIAAIFESWKVGIWNASCQCAV